MNNARQLLQSYRLLESYRLLVAELLDCPSMPSLHEGTDLAVSDFVASDDALDVVKRHPWHPDPRIVLEKMSILCRLGHLSVDEIESYGQINGGLTAMEQEYLKFVKTNPFNPR